MNEVYCSLVTAAPSVSDLFLVLAFDSTYSTKSRRLVASRLEDYSFQYFFC